MTENKENAIKGITPTKELMGMTLASCLSKEQYEEATKRWADYGGEDVIPWWKWCLENVEVSLKTDAFTEYAKENISFLICCMLENKAPLSSPATTVRLLEYMVSENIISLAIKEKFMSLWKLTDKV